LVSVAVNVGSPQNHLMDVAAGCTRRCPSANTGGGGNEGVHVKQPSIRTYNSSNRTLIFIPRLIKMVEILFSCANHVSMSLPVVVQTPFGGPHEDHEESG
jgi:hypothetical protein